MSTITKEQVQQQAQSLLRLVMVHRGTPLMTRIQLYCVEKTKLKLPDYIANQSVPEEERMQFMRDLTALLEEKRYDELPEVPQGQTTSAPPPSITPPAAPKLVPAAPKPAPKPVELEPPSTNDMPVEDDGDAHVETDPLAIIMAQLQKLKAPKPAAPGLTEADVKRIVKDEGDNIRALVRMELEDYLVELLMNLPVGIRARLQEEDAT